jgi:hypothetical protein
MVGLSFLKLEALNKPRLKVRLRECDLNLLMRLQLGFQGSSTNMGNINLLFQRLQTSHQVIG